jgi:membrane-bound ClpP family serine protease
MKLSSNIDRRGRKVRLVAGIFVDACGVALIVTRLFRGGTGILIGGIAATLFGSFMIFEAANGWCLLRAMGFKTRL